MINIKLVAVGKLKEKFHKEEVSEYVKRLSRYASATICEVEEMQKVVKKFLGME